MPADVGIQLLRGHVSEGGPSEEKVLGTRFRGYD